MLRLESCEGVSEVLKNYCWIGKVFSTMCLDPLAPTLRQLLHQDNTLFRYFECGRFPPHQEETAVRGLVITKHHPIEAQM